MGENRVIPSKEFFLKAKSTPLFKSLDQKTLEFIFEHAEFYEMPTDMEAIKQGAVGASVFVLLSGTAAAEYIDKNKNKRYLAKFRPGNFFGEGAFFADGIRGASIKITTPSRLVELKVPLLKELIEKYPIVYETLYQTHLERVLDLKTKIKKSLEMLRTDPRIIISGDAKFQLGGVAGKNKKIQFGLIKNVSGSGCKIEMEGNIFKQYQTELLGREIPLKIKLPGENETIDAIGKVVWHEQASGMDVFGYRYNFGIRFIKIMGKGKVLLSKASFQKIRK